jgi:hypothetical protein
VNVIGYVWAGPNTLLGPALALLALGGGRMSVVRGVLEVHGPALRWMLRHLTLVPAHAGPKECGKAVPAQEPSLRRCTSRFSAG